MKRIKVVEYFFSLQGEGVFVGTPSFFIRFPLCNLSCKYCDTDFQRFKEVDVNVILDEYKKCGEVPVVFTGGEPLLHTDEIIYFSHYFKDIHLETNGTLWEKMRKILHLIDFVSMDVKIPSSSGHILWDDHLKFTAIVGKKKGQFKIVFDENIKEEELEKVKEITDTIPSWFIIFQPVYGMKISMELIKRIVRRFAPNRVRIIPQVHKVLNIK